MLNISFLVCSTVSWCCASLSVFLLVPTSEVTAFFKKEVCQHSGLLKIIFMVGFIPLWFWVAWVSIYYHRLFPSHNFTAEKWKWHISLSQAQFKNRKKKKPFLFFWSHSDTLSFLQPFPSTALFSSDR